MNILTQKAFRYYNKRDGPMACLRNIPYDEAIQINHKFKHTQDERIDYMAQRITFERIMYRSFLRKGGKPKNTFAYYFTVGHKKIIQEYFKEPALLSIPITMFSPETISFTYCDSFLTYSRKDNHPTQRKLYTLYEIENIIDQYGFEFDEGDHMAFIEMQVWDDEPLLSYCIKNNVHGIGINDG